MRARSARRVIADRHPGFPCRVSLVDAQPTFSAAGMLLDADVTEGAKLGATFERLPARRGVTGEPVPQSSRPKTATPVWAPTNTLPSAIVGVMNLLPGPN
jgi:hypothetical protein